MIGIDSGVDEKVAVRVYPQVGVKCWHGTFGGDGNLSNDAVACTLAVESKSAPELQGMCGCFKRQIGPQLGGALEVILVLVPFPKFWQHGCRGKHAQHQAKVESS